MALTINEMFVSIQGESTWAGLPSIFVRLTGCNLRCRYCDTPYAYDQGDSWQLDPLLAHLASLKWRRVCITGGEPLLQNDTFELIARLLNDGYQISLETNGSMDISAVDRRCVKIMDVKCPSSGMHRRNRFENFAHMGAGDQTKFVIADMEDFYFACDTTREIEGALSADRILFSPAHNQLAASQLAQWMLDRQINARLQIQLHKYLWPDIDRGV